MSFFLPGDSSFFFIPDGGPQLRPPQGGAGSGRKPGGLPGGRVGEAPLKYVWGDIHYLSSTEKFDQKDDRKKNLKEEL